MGQPEKPNPDVSITDLAGDKAAFDAYVHEQYLDPAEARDAQRYGELLEHEQHDLESIREQAVGRTVDILMAHGLSEDAEQLAQHVVQAYGEDAIKEAMVERIHQERIAPAEQARDLRDAA